MKEGAERPELEGQAALDISSHQVMEEVEIGVLEVADQAQADPGG